MTNTLYIFCGIPFAGKTTLARALAKSLGYSRIDLDEVKFSLFGEHIKDSAIDRKAWDRVYKAMYEQIKQCLSRGETVIHDAGNFTRHERGLVRAVANNLRKDAITVFVDTPIEVAKERLIQNRIASQPQRTAASPISRGQPL